MAGRAADTARSFYAVRRGGPTTFHPSGQTGHVIFRGAGPSDELPSALANCHGLTCLAAAGGWLLHPGDAQAEPLAASWIRALLLLEASAYPRARIDRRGSAIP